MEAPWPREAVSSIVPRDSAETEEATQPVIDRGCGQWPHPTDPRSEAFDWCRAHMLDEHKASVQQIRLRRVNGDTLRCWRPGTRERTDHNEVHPASVRAVNRHHDGWPSSSLLVPANGIEIRPPDVAAPRLRTAAAALAIDPTSHRQANWDLASIPTP